MIGQCFWTKLYLNAMVNILHKAIVDGFVDKSSLDSCCVRCMFLRKYCNCFSYKENRVREVHCQGRL